MGEVVLSVREVAELLGKTTRHIQELLKKGGLIGEQKINKTGRPQWEIDIDSLDLEFQRKYYKLHPPVAPLNPVKTKVDSKPLDTYSASERDEIVMWIDIINKWQGYRAKATNKTEVDEQYVQAVKLDYPDLPISTGTLYRRWKAYKASDYDGLIDKRGQGHTGKTAVTKDMWDAFLHYYINQAQHTVVKCYEYMQMAIKEQYPEQYDNIPSVATFRRKLERDLPKQHEVLGRLGEKAYKDKCGLHIQRIYDGMLSNDYWIGDTHTIDVQSKDENGTIHRLYLSAWMDARSGVFVGWNIATSSSSQNTLLALRHAIMRHGLPVNVYVDNGREFLNHDIGGMGHRARKSQASKKTDCEPPPILKRLGITMINAIVKNAKAKTIERRFCDFKEQISKAFTTYTGGNIMERPEQLKLRVKNGEVILDQELIKDIDMMIEFGMNYETYGGAVISDRSKRKIDVYNQNLAEQRVAEPSELELMLMRSTRPQTYNRQGVHVTVGSKKINFMSEELRAVIFGKQVYVRYDPNDLSSVRVYDEQDRFIGTADCADKLVCEYGAGTEEIKEAHKIIRKAERTDKDAVAAIRTIGFPTVRELVLARAYDNKNSPANKANPKILKMHRAVEQPLIPKAVGSDVDLDKMLKNAENKRR